MGEEAFKVLIVDDEEAVLLVTKFVLEDTGWMVMTANSAHEGIATAEAERPDVILSDVSMPGMDGVTMLQFLQANPTTQPIPVILLTSRTEPVAHYHSKGLTVQAIIAKPFDVATLADRVTAVLKNINQIT